jgi:hypothetical protein
MEIQQDTPLLLVDLGDTLSAVTLSMTQSDLMIGQCAMHLDHTIFHVAHRTLFVRNYLHEFFLETHSKMNKDFVLVERKAKRDRKRERERERMGVRVKRKRYLESISFQAKFQQLRIL